MAQPAPKIVPVTEFVIDRSKWLPGEVQYELGVKAKLLEPSTGRQCCIGVYLSACGMPDDALLNEGWATAVLDADHPLHAWFTAQTEAPQSQHRENALAFANDICSLGLAERERRITEEFARGGVTVTFTGELFPEDS